jgi:hypothetical protein
MPIKYRLFQAIGAISLIGGCVLATIQARFFLFAVNPDGWLRAGVLLSGVTSIYFIYVGFRLLRFGSSPPPMLLGWGRILSGIWMVFSEIHIRLRPAANRLKPSNEVQAAGMYIAFAIILSIGIALVIWGASRYKGRWLFATR